MSTCPKCNAENDVNKNFCSNCGTKLSPAPVATEKKPEISKTTSFIFGVLALVLIGWVIQTCNDSPTPGNSLGNKNPSQETPKQPEKPAHNMNEAINVGHFYYMVSNVKVRKTIGDLRSSGYYVLINVGFQNHDNETRTLDNSFFQLYDSIGKEYDVSTEAITQLEMSGISTLFLKACGPGLVKSGVIAFEIPEKGNYKLKLSGGFAETSHEYVNIPAK